MAVHYTFNTPVGQPAAMQCGRVMYSDFHVNTGAAGNGTLPGACNLGTGVKMTAQEKVLEFMIFDLTSCLKPTSGTCTPKTCAQQGYNCGAQGDTCGGIIASCGTCTAPAICGGNGVPGQCGNGCTPKTCAQQGFDCGNAGDGCGNVINCGTCPMGQFCGGGGIPGVCGTPPG